MFIFLMLASPLFAGMSDIDLQVREIISEHLQVSWDDIHSMNFTASEETCLFTVAARAQDQYCKVCFQGDWKDNWADSVRCEPYMGSSNILTEE